jgi:hypothetical protein
MNESATAGLKRYLARASEPLLQERLASAIEVIKKRGEGLAQTQK